MENHYFQTSYKLHFGFNQNTFRFIENMHNLKNRGIKMRSWSLVCASCSASLVSVFSFVIPFCLFLNYRQNHLIHVVSDGMEVMMYLTPILSFWLLSFI
jgi:hypothetical protein